MSGPKVFVSEKAFAWLNERCLGDLLPDGEVCYACEIADALAAHWHDSPTFGAELQHARRGCGECDDGRLLGDDAEWEPCPKCSPEVE